MHPPTPYPASARTISRRDEKAPRVTARASVVSKSEQDFVSVKKKAEEEAARKPRKTPAVSRRYSVASKFAGPRADASDIASGEAKPRINKRASFASVPQGSFTQASLPSGKNAIVTSKTTTNKQVAPSGQATIPGSVSRRQSLVPEQAIKLHKPTFDLHKRTSPGYEKGELTQTTHTNKGRGLLLKSARYWLEQVRLAEVMEKHGVSTGFFRLAVECEAEPVEVLREAFVSYVKRHSLWSNDVQQVLRCYGVTNEAQETSFSQLSADGITESSAPCTPAKNLKGILSSDQDLLDQVPKKDLKCSGVSFNNTACARFNNTSPKDTAHDSSMKKEFLASHEMPVVDASEHIESLDADSVTREVVSYIMSSMNHSDSSENLQKDGLSGPKDSSMLANSDLNNHASSAVLVAENSVVQVRESMSTLNVRNSEEAVPQGSPPSLSVWNTLSNEGGIGKLDVQEEVSITLDNDLTDSVSTERGTGEEMCISMELDIGETANGDLSDLQSKSPICQCDASEESHAAQTTIETDANVLKALDVNRSSDEVISADQTYEGLSKNLIHQKSHDRVSGIVQVFKKCESGSYKDLKPQISNPKAETEKATDLQMNHLPDAEGNSRSCSSFSVTCQNGKRKSTPASGKKKAELPALKKDNGAALVLQKSMRLQTLTPKSSTLTPVTTAEAGSRTRRRSRVSQLMESGIESNHMHLESAIAALEGILSTPRQYVKDGSRQASLNIVEGTIERTTDIMGSTATPGSAGVRRSARLMRTGCSTMSTPGSVSTRVHRQLQTPMKADKEVGT